MVDFNNVSRNTNISTLREIPVNTGINKQNLVQTQQTASLNTIGDKPVISRDFQKDSMEGNLEFNPAASSNLGGLCLKGSSNAERIINDLKRYIGDPKGFAEQINRILEDPAKRESLIKHFELNCGNNPRDLGLAMSLEAGKGLDSRSFMPVGTVILNRALANNLAMAASGNSKRFSIAEIIMEKGQFDPATRNGIKMAMDFMDSGKPILGKSDIAVKAREAVSVWSNNTKFTHDPGHNRGFQDVINQHILGGHFKWDGNDASNTFFFRASSMSGSFQEQQLEVGGHEFAHNLNRGKGEISYYVNGNSLINRDEKNDKYTVETPARTAKK